MTMNQDMKDGDFFTGCAWGAFFMVTGIVAILAICLLLGIWSPYSTP